MTHVVIAGVSTRAAAASAAAAGFDVTAIDGYADRDQHPQVKARSLTRDTGGTFTAAAAASAAISVEADAAVYLSNFENDPAAVEQLAARRALWGNPPDVLRQARDPFVVAEVFRAHGFPTPRLVNVPPEPNDANDRNGWLLKPLSSGGGHGIRAWDERARVGRGHYLQERIDGTPGSIVFLAAAGHMVPLGVSRQLVGDGRFGVSGYRYCGNILAPALDRQFFRASDLMEAARRLADVASAGLSLVGANGLDFVEHAGVPYPVEINPRWTAVMELVERAAGVNVFAGHAAACSRGELGAAVPPPSRALGKAVVFARHRCCIGNTDHWLADPDIRDVPHAGDTIAAGSPVCTVFADAADAASCEATLASRAESIYAQLEGWRASPFTIHDS